MTVPCMLGSYSGLADCWSVARQLVETNLGTRTPYFEESSAANDRSLARYFKLGRLWDEEKHEFLTCADS